MYEYYIGANVRLLQPCQMLPPLTIIDSFQDVYITQHSAEGQILRTDHRYVDTRLFLFLHPPQLKLSGKRTNELINQKIGQLIIDKHSYSQRMNVVKYLD